MDDSGNLFIAQSLLDAMAKAGQPVLPGVATVIPDEHFQRMKRQAGGHDLTPDEFRQLARLPRRQRRAVLADLRRKARK
jgi:hypothetical protein